MRHFKVISICLVTLFLSIAITSYSSTSIFSNNQALATLANNDNIGESIKKVCPTYEGNNNNNIKGTVTNIIKSCLPQSGQPPTSPNPSPSPSPSPLDRNIVKFVATSQGPEVLSTIVITDNTTQKSNTYDIIDEQVQDEFVIPVGDTYQITVTPEDPNIEAQITINGNDCGSFSQPIICTATMGSLGADLQVIVNDG